MAKLQLGTKLKTLQSDNAMEYVSWSTHLQANGIIHRFSCPYIHKQNGIAKRKHKHVAEIGLTLLATASLPFTFSADTFTIVAQLINSLPYPIFDNLFH